LWQGVHGTNNPCPDGFRLPTISEWQTERLSWISNNPAGAFASPLKLVLGGMRSPFDGSIWNSGSFGYYWSSSVSGTDAMLLNLVNGWGGSSALENNYYRGGGACVRCIKD
jgi:hypothetical protein